jgi:hypothetical protein
MTSRPFIGIALSVMLKPLRSSCAQAAATLVQNAFFALAVHHKYTVRNGFLFAFHVLVSRWFFVRVHRGRSGVSKGRQKRAGAQRRVRPRDPLGDALRIRAAGLAHDKNGRVERHPTEDSETH